MPTQVLSIGYVIPMTQNQVYALPTREVYLFCETAAATLEQSNTVGFALANAITLDANKQAILAGGFIRLTSAGPVNVIVKAD